LLGFPACCLYHIRGLAYRDMAAEAQVGRKTTRELVAQAQVHVDRSEPSADLLLRDILGEQGKLQPRLENQALGHAQIVFPLTFEPQVTIF